MMTNIDQNRKDNAIHIRVSSRQKMAIKKLAEANGMTITDMVMDVLNRKISQANQQEPATAAA